MATGVSDFTISFTDTPGYFERGEIVSPTRYYVEIITGFSTPYGDPATPYSSLVGVVSPTQYDVERHISFASGYFGPAQPFFYGVATRLATGSGVGSATSTQLRVVSKTATGSGTSSESAAAIELLPRSATGTGLGTSGGGATSFLTAIRSATGSGQGSEETIQVWGKVRLATGDGTGESVTVYRRELFRTASDSGTGTADASGTKVYRATATGSGTGSESGGTFNRIMFFRPPTDNLVRWADIRGQGIAHRLFSYFEPGARGRNVYKLTDGSFTENEQRDMSIVAITYYGGHDNPITEDERQDLVDAGYGDYVS